MDERTKSNVAGLIILAFGFFLGILFNGCMSRLLSAPAPVPRERTDGPIPYWQYQRNIDNYVYWRDGNRIRQSLLTWNKYTGNWIVLWEEATEKDWQGVPSQRWSTAEKRRVYRTPEGCRRWEFQPKERPPVIPFVAEDTY